VVATFIDGILESPKDRAHRHDDDIGVLHSIRTYEATAIAPGGCQKLLGDLGNSLECVELTQMGKVAHLFERFGPHHGADETGAFVSSTCRGS